MRHGQVAFEFTFLIGAGMAMMIVLLIVASSLAYKESSKQQQTIMLEFGRTIQDEVILATYVHDGYEREFYLPDRIGRYKYSIDNGNDSFTITSDQAIFTFPTPRITGVFVKGDNIITKSSSGVKIN